MDRLTRGDSAETADLERWVRDRRKMLLIADGLKYPCEGTDGAMWDFQKRQAHQEWLNTQERYTRMQNNRREIGSAVGLPSFGYRIARRADGRKFFELTDIGRNYIPGIYKRIIAGDSLLDVARWLTAEGVPTVKGGRWNENYIGNTLLRNPIYYGQRRNGGNLETEGAVPFAVWQEANAVMAARPRVGRSTVVRPKPLVMPLCGACYDQEREGCPSGRSPMYRTNTGRATSRRLYFKCMGHGPQRKSCGTRMIPAEQLERDVIDAMMADHRLQIERVFVAGDSRADQISQIREQAMAAYRAGDKARFLELDAQADAMDEEPSEAAHWAERYAGPCVEGHDPLHLQCGHQTEAEYFASLDRDGQRTYLAAFEITATKDGVTIFPRAWA